MIKYPEDATPLDPDELEGLKFPHVTTRGELDHLEQANIQNGLLWLARYKSHKILNDQFARKLHFQLFGDVWSWAGQYRLTEKNIGIDPLYISVRLRELLDNVQYWLDQDTYSPKEAASRFHHQLVYIHPFPNGNGRYARFFTDALLEKVYLVDRIDWSGGFDLQQMNERRREYIRAIKAADAGDYALLFQITGVYQ